MELTANWATDAGMWGYWDAEVEGGVVGFGCPLAHPHV